MSDTRHPVWCTRDHSKNGHHVRRIGATETILVQLLQWPGAVQGFVQIIDCRDAETRPPSVDTDELPAFARLMGRLGHEDIAALVRKAHATFAAGVAYAAAGPLDFETAWRRTAASEAREAGR